MIPSCPNRHGLLELTHLQLPSLQDLHVLVIGDVMLDRYWHGPTSRVSPEAPVPVVDVEHTEDCPGGGANVALNVKSLGAMCTLLGCVGDDALGDTLKRKLDASGVCEDFIVSPDASTTLKLRVVSRHQQLLRTDFEKPTSAWLARKLAMKVPSQLEDANALIIADYDKGAIHDPAALIEAARRINVPVVVDPKAKPFRAYAGATVLKPNHREFAAATGDWRNETELGERAVALCADLDIGALVITHGAGGMSVATSEGYHHLPARPVEVFDVTGAGDTAAAVLGITSALGWPVLDGARLANIAASIAVAKAGTAAVSGPELAMAASHGSVTDRGILSRDQLALVAKSAAAAGEKLVFTNGCFDVLHAGHVRYLEEARALGDRLIVAVNDDASVARLKGPGRPVNGLDRRLRVLAGLESVDWVAPFDEDTPNALLELLRPHVLAKGGDYKPHEVVGADFVRSYGGKVRVLAHVEDCSTSAILERMKGRGTGGA